MRIYEKARELGITSKELLEFLEKQGIADKTSSSSLEPDMLEKIAEHFSAKPKKLSAKELLASKLAAKTKPELESKSEETPETEADRRRRERREAILKSIGSANPKPVTPKKIAEVEPEKPKTQVPKTADVELPPKPKKPKKLKPLRVFENMKVTEYAEAAEVTVRDVLRACMTFGVMATANQKLTLDIIEAVSEELGFFPILVDEAEFFTPPQEEIVTEKEVLPPAPEDEPIVAPVPTPETEPLKKPKKKKKKKTPQPGDETRPPVVTVMGHVDHGKTTLLDYIRNANVVAGEKGGITQHVGAYSVQTPQGSITFIDTPGHAAFTEMRARGADVTDIVILVVSQEDGLMPQTKEAINHARAADVPIILAINKMDLPGANPDKVKAELANFGLMVEDLGGDVLSVEISALKGQGVDKLLELVALQAEMMELKANPEGPAKGVVIEALLDKFRGSTATILLKEGSLKQGDSFVTGCCYGRIRSMEDERGKKLKTAGPSTPVVITGLSEVPQAGDEFTVVKSDAEARKIAEEAKQAHETATPTDKGMSLEDFFSLLKEEEVKELPLIIKADVDGSLEAIIGLISDLGDDEVKVRIISSGVGAITENDVLLAEASKAVVIGFNVKPDNRAKSIASNRGIDVKFYDVIYELSADVKAALEGLLEPDVIEERVGIAVIRQLFKIPRVGVVAGSYVQDGVFRRGFKVEIVRAGEVIGTGRVSALKRYKDDVKEVTTGFECGIEISGFNDLHEGDTIIAIEVKEITRRLE